MVEPKGTPIKKHMKNARKMLRSYRGQDLGFRVGAHATVGALGSLLGASDLYII